MCLPRQVKLLWASARTKPALLIRNINEICLSHVAMWCGIWLIYLAFLFALSSHRQMYLRDEIGKKQPIHHFNCVQSKWGLILVSLDWNGCCHLHTSTDLTFYKVIQLSFSKGGPRRWDKKHSVAAWAVISPLHCYPSGLFSAEPLLCPPRPYSAHLLLTALFEHEWTTGMRVTGTAMQKEKGHKLKELEMRLK